MAQACSEGAGDSTVQCEGFTEDGWSQGPSNPSLNHFSIQPGFFPYIQGTALWAEIRVKVSSPGSPSGAAGPAARGAAQQSSHFPKLFLSATQEPGDFCLLPKLRKIPGTVLLPHPLLPLEKP